MDNKERMQIIATNITNYRKAKGITQKQLAEAIGISQSSMTEYMKLRTAPSFGVIQKLADYFGVSEDFLCGTENNELNEETLKKALFGEDFNVTDSIWQEVKNYIEFIKTREKA